MNDRWMWAGLAVAGGLAVGAVARIVLRRLLDRDGRRDGVREVAIPLSTFAFWVFTATGIVVAVSTSSPETLRPVPRNILDWLPNLAIAGLLIIAGYGLGLTVAAGVGRTLAGASGTRDRSLERGVRAVVLAGAVILALSQIGVDTTVLNILIAGLVFAVAGTLAGLATVGGKNVANHIAAGRSLAGHVTVGSHLRIADIEGVVTEAHATHLAIQTRDGLVLVPYGSIIDEPIYVLPDQ